MHACRITGSSVKKMQIDDGCIVAFKNTLERRAPEYYFSDGDIAVLEAQTGLNRTTIETWAALFRESVPEASRADWLYNRLDAS